jgi:hypothetical protein
MKFHQKILILVVMLALIWGSMGWIAGVQAVPASGLVQTSTGAAQVSAGSVMSPEMAYLLPSFPGMMPNVSWNG